MNNTLQKATPILRFEAACKKLAAVEMKGEVSNISHQQYPAFVFVEKGGFKYKELCIKL